VKFPAAGLTFLAHRRRNPHTVAVTWRTAAVVTTCFVLAAAGGVAVAFATQTQPAHRHTATLSTQPVAASPSPSSSVIAESNAGAGPYFATPQAAMRYLAAAYNRHDKSSLWYVTTPDGRNAIEQMRSEAINLRLRACTKNPAGDYTCVFDHDYPPSMHKAGHGTATFIAGPARDRGWYMTVFEGCG
jgi:hypothetical protein